MREATAIVEDIADGVIVRHKPYNFDTLDSALKELFDKLGVQIPVCSFEDSASIREQFYTELVNGSLAVLYPAVAEEWHQEKNGAITPNMISYGSNARFWWKCSTCQHEWITTVADRTVGGKGCSKCAKDKLSRLFKMKHDVFVERLKVVNSNLEPLEKYNTTHESILILCKVCGNKWFAAPANLLRGRDCPVCSRRRCAQKMSAIKLEYYKNKKEES